MAQPIFQEEHETEEHDWMVRYGLIEKGTDKYVLEYLILMREADNSITPRVKSEVIVHKSMSREEQISTVLDTLLPIVEKKLWKNKGFTYINPIIKDKITEKWPK